MASSNTCLASLARLSLSSAARPQATTIPRFLIPSAFQSRNAGGGGMRKKTPKKRKMYKTFKTHDLDNIEQFSLCDAVRYIRAFEVGHPPTSSKYAVALKIKTLKNGPVLRNRIQLPHPVKSDIRIGVVCKEDSAIAEDAKASGAIAVGEESIFQAVKAGDIQFNRLICHTDSVPALNSAGVARILGPRGMMPNMKTKTITNNVKGLMRELSGAADYRERNGVLRLAVGQLGFTPQMLADNIKAFMGQAKKEIGALEDTISKDVDEVVISSTHSPGFSLSGGFNPTDDKILPAHLATPM